jgi:hypothetical protein
MKLLLSCREASRLISEKLDRDLSVPERATLRVHLAICVACTRLTRQFEFLRRAVTQFPGPDDGPGK